jgi:hypothetical protein
MRLFGSDRIVKVMEKMGLEEGQELEHFMLNKSIEQAQKRVEQHNFQRRKRTLEYDDVMNKQREVIYGFRNEVINAPDVRDRLMDIMEEVVIEKVEELTTESADPANGTVRPLADWVNLNFPHGHPGGGNHQGGQSGQELPVAGSAFDGLSAAQFAVCQFICKAVPQGLRLKISFEQPDALKSGRALHHPQSAWTSSGRSIFTDGQPAGQHRPAGLRPARSAHRIQGRGVQDFRGIDGQHQNGDLPQHLPQRLQHDGL